MISLINNFTELEVIYVAVGLVALAMMIGVIMLINDYYWYKKMENKNRVLKNKFNTTVFKVVHYRQNADKNASLNRTIHINIKKPVFN